MRPITIKEVEFLAFRLAHDYMAFDEPIPDFSTRNPGSLESCLATGFQTYAKRDLYPTLFGKAAITFYLMIKDHPLQNGNKRIALTTLLVFLYLNNKWLRATNDEIYQLAVWVAASPPKFKKHVISAIKDFLRTHAVSL
jgi:death-on-curing protein